MPDDLLDEIPCGFLSVADDGTVLRMNATLRELVATEGAPSEGAVGRHIDRLLSPGARIFYQTHVFPLLKAQGRVEEVYLSLRTGDGADVPVLLNAVRRERGGRPVTAAAVVPMRRRNQFESELLQAKKAAEEANRTRTRFLSILSHDLRAPLSAINMAAEMLEAGAVGPVNDAQRRDLGRVREASGYVLRLMTDLLNFSRLEAGRVDVRVQPVPLPDVLDRADSIAGPLAADAGLTLEREGDTDELVRADAERLQQVLLNLLTNAVKFTDRGGRITLAAERAGDRVRLRVRDTGRGIASEQLDDIFSPFVQLEQPGEHAPRDGVGLGLAISRELVRAMGGDLTVVSEVGVGSTFSIELSVAEPDDGT